MTVMAPDQNAVNAVFYALSTLAQTCAALAALVGALALYKLQSMRERRMENAQTIRAVAMPGLGRRDATRDEVLSFARTHLGLGERSGMSSGVLEQLRVALNEWDAFDPRYRRTVTWLVIFEGCNLLAILVALVGFACVTWLATHWTTFVVLLILSAVMTVAVTSCALAVMARGDSTPHSEG